MEKRENATIWESKTTGCYEFQCHNDSGPVYWKKCNKTDEICENDQCVVKKEVTYYVEIEVDGIDVTELNTTEIRSAISDLTGIEEGKLRIRVETNEKDEIIRIIVVVDNEEIAEEIKNKINVAINEHNQEGIVRHFKSVRVKENNLFISCGTMKERKAFLFFSFIMTSIITLIYGM